MAAMDSVRGPAGRGGYRRPVSVHLLSIRPSVWAATRPFTISQPSSKITSSTGIPMTTTTKPVLCQKYGDACHPEIAMPTITKTRKPMPR